MMRVKRHARAPLDLLMARIFEFSTSTDYASWRQPLPLLPSPFDGIAFEPPFGEVGQLAGWENTHGEGIPDSSSASRAPLLGM